MRMTTLVPCGLLLATTTISCDRTRVTPVGTVLAEVKEVPQSPMLDGIVGPVKGPWTTIERTYEFAGPALGSKSARFKVSYEIAEAAFSPQRHDLDSGPATYDSIHALRSVKITVAANNAWEIYAECQTPHSSEYLGTRGLAVILPCPVTLQGRGEKFSTYAEISGDGSVHTTRDLEWDVQPVAP